MRFEYRQLAFRGSDSTLAAQSAECAAQQGRFWDFHDAIFENWTPDVFGRENNKRVAASLGLDTSAFDKCLDRGRVQEHVAADMALAAEMGVNSTPTVLVNGRPIVGLHDFSDYQQLIEEELAAAGACDEGTAPSVVSCGP